MPEKEEKDPLFSVKLFRICKSLTAEERKILKEVIEQDGGKNLVQLLKAMEQM